MLTLMEMCRTIREISTASGLPIVVDADTGYGEVEMVGRTVVEYARAGAAARGGVKTPRPRYGGVAPREAQGADQSAVFADLAQNCLSRGSAPELTCATQQAAECMLCGVANTN